MKRFRVLLTVVVLVALGAGAYGLGLLLRPAPELGGTRLENPVDVSGVRLVNARLGEVALGEFRGKVVAVFFGYSNCPDVCPITLSRLAASYRELGEPDDLQVVMITVDPANDTPEVVQAYAANFHPSFLGLSGSNEAIAEAAQTFFVGYQQATDKLFNHTDMVMLLDREGRWRYVYGQGSMPELVRDLPTLLAQRSW